MAGAATSSDPAAEGARGPVVRRRSDAFANARLVTHDGRRMRFVDDLVRGRPRVTLIVQFLYTHCEGICYPTTLNLARVCRHLGSRMGRDVELCSITLDPDRDTPAVLARHRSKFGDVSGWTFFTGRYDEIEALRRSLGVYDLDPEVDADRSQHAGIVTFGCDAIDRWSALPGEMEARDIARAVLFSTRGARRA